jgi:Alpha/beta hydrolase domain
LAIGASQSEGRLVLYHNSIHPLAGVFDAFFLYLGLGGLLRTDLDVKVFKVNTETDLLFLGEVAARQPDSDKLRTWEVAGASHVGFAGFANRVALTMRDGLPVPNPSPCTRPALSHIPTFHVLNAVYEHLARWVAEDIGPPTAPPVEVVSAGPPVVLARDSFGNALGGVRLAEHAVPTAVNDGINSGPGFCFLYRGHIPFDDATLAALYPNHGSYVSQVSHVTNDNLAAGYILADDAEATKESAGQSDIGKKKH